MKSRRNTGESKNKKTNTLLVQDSRSLEFTATKVFMKIFCTGSSTVITECQHNFNVLVIQRQLTIPTAESLPSFYNIGNYICQLFNSMATYTN
jgi:hypothetical protein